MNPFTWWGQQSYRRRRYWWLAASVLVFTVELGREMIRHDDNVSPFIIGLGFWCFAQSRWYRGWLDKQEADDTPPPSHSGLCAYCDQPATTTIWTTLNGKTAQTVWFCDRHAQQAGTDIRETARMIVYGRQDGDSATV